MFHQGIFDPNTIDRGVLEARKAYHQADDAVSHSLDVRVFKDETIFDQIRYVDFYRYCNVSLDEMLVYLDKRVPWVRPADTGRSTNCLINEAGIYVHKNVRGYHNYALPYSWDVRLGHKKRDAARKELDDNIHIDNVQRILHEIGYPLHEISSIRRRRLLVAYYVSPVDIDPQVLKNTLGQRLPNEFIPTHFVRLDHLPLTANGKIDRDALPEPDETRPQLAQTYVAPSGQVEEALAEIWSHILGVDKVGVNDNFFDLGGDSILNIQIVSRAKQRGLVLTPQQIFDHQTIGSVAQVVGRTQKGGTEQGPVIGEVQLTPIQRWFFEQGLPEPHHYNQAVLLEVITPPNPLVLEEALRYVRCHHDALRSRFEIDGTQWRQVINSTDDVVETVERIDLTAMSSSAQDAAVEAHAAKLHASLNLERGLLMRTTLFDRGLGRSMLLMIVIHHLVVDGVSWWILLEDLESAYHQLTSGTGIQLPSKTTSVKRWSNALTQYSTSPELAKTVAFWRNSNIGPTGIPVDFHDRGDNDLASTQTLSVALSASDTQALVTDVPKKWRTQVPDLLLTALVKTLTDWSGQSSIQLDLESHGREDVVEGLDLLRTVGWFTTIYPVTFTSEDWAITMGHALKRIKEQLRAIPLRGIGFGVLRYLAGNADVAKDVANIPCPQVLFNYMGQWGRTFVRSSMFTLMQPITASFGRYGQRRYLLEFNAVIFDGQLRIDWTYSRNLHSDATVSRLAEEVRANLEALIAHCLSAHDDGWTPSDFPTADLSQSELDDLLTHFGES